MPNRRRNPGSIAAYVAEIVNPAAVIPHEVAVDACPDCGAPMTRTDQFTDHLVEEIPEPKVEVHRYRRYVCRCSACGRTATACNDLATPGSQVGQRAKLLTVYSRAHLGISLGKTVDLFDHLFGLSLSTAAAVARRPAPTPSPS